MSEQTHDPELAGFERTLKSLSPAPAAMDRDVLMFQAGRASARRNGWRWPVATAVLASTAIVFALLWQQRPAVVIVDRPVPQIVERIVYKPAPEREPEPFTAVGNSPEPGPVVQTGYVRLRNDVLRWGMDALPHLPTAAAATPPLEIKRPRFFDPEATKARGDRS